MANRIAMVGFSLFIGIIIGGIVDHQGAYKAGAADTAQSMYHKDAQDLIDHCKMLSNLVAEQIEYEKSFKP